MMVLLLILLVLLLDRVLGEPKCFHPLIGFGRLADWIEVKLNKKPYQQSDIKHDQNTSLFQRGIIAWMLAVIPITVLIYIVDRAIGGIWIAVICGWLTIGWKSLRQHGLAVVQAFDKHDLDEARLKTSYLVSRDTSKLDETALSRATTESILENGSDAIFAPIFWLIIFGALGVVLYRLSNTLDAMWGYRNDRFEQFGKFTARVDDALNYIPARITALLYLLFGNSKQALQAWKTQGKLWYSPNAGVVMATGAGSLELRLGGNAIYHGKLKQRPELGAGCEPNPDDIRRAVQLIDKGVYAIFALCLIAYIILKFK